MGDEPFAFARAVVELVLPAVLADVHAMEVFGAFIEEKGMKGLLVGKGLAAGFTGGSTGLDVPFVHVFQIKPRNGAGRQRRKMAGDEGCVTSMN
jgi:hypothetical protein